KRIVELLKAGEEEARFSKMLATIRRDAPIEFELPQTEWAQGVDTKKASEIFGRFEFRTLGSKLESALLSLGANVDSPKRHEDIDEALLEETKVALWVADSNITKPELADILNFANTDSFVEA